MLIYCSCIQDEELARQLVELGYRGSGEVLKREEFEARKLAAAASKLARRDQQRCVILINAVADTVTFESHTVVSLSLFDRIVTIKSTVAPWIIYGCMQAQWEKLKFKLPLVQSCLYCRSHDMMSGCVSVMCVYVFIFNTSYTATFLLIMFS